MLMSSPTLGRKGSTGSNNLGEMEWEGAEWNLEKWVQSSATSNPG